MNEALSKVLRRGASGSFGVNIIGVLAVFVLQISLGKTLGVESYGIYSYVLSWAGILVLVAALGLDAAQLRFVPIYQVQERYGLLAGLLRYSNRLTCIAAILLGCCLGAVGYLRRDVWSIELVWSFYTAALLLPVWTLNLLRQSSLRGLKAVVSARLPDVVVRPVLITLFVLGVHSILQVELEAPLALALHVYAGLITFFLGSILLRRQLPAQLEDAPVEFERHAWWDVAVPLLGVGLLGIVGNEVDKIIVAWFSDSASVGLYAAASRLSYFTLFALDAIATIAAPMIAEVYGAQGVRELQKFVREVTRLVALCTIPAVLVLALGGPSILGLFGADFVMAYPLLLVLTVGNLANVVFGPAGFVLNMTGQQRQSVLILTVALGVQVVAAVIGAYLYGALGVAFGTVIGWIVRNFLMWSQCKSALQIDTGVLAAFSSR